MLTLKKTKRNGRLTKFRLVWTKTAVGRKILADLQLNRGRHLFQCLRKMVSKILRQVAKKWQLSVWQRALRTPQRTVENQRVEFKLPFNKSIRIVAKVEEHFWTDAARGGFAYSWARARLIFKLPPLLDDFRGFRNRRIDVAFAVASRWNKENVGNPG